MAGTYHACTPTTASYFADPAGYASFITSMSPHAVVGVIAGPSTSDLMTGAITMPFGQTLGLLPSCTATINSHYNIARPGLRLASFLSGFGDHGLYRTICQTDYTAAMADIANVAIVAFGTCFEGNIQTTDVDPQNEGLQLPCTFSDSEGGIIPPCQMSDPFTPNPSSPHPCWWAKLNPVTCPTTPTQLEFHIERTVAPPAGDVVHVSCPLAGG
jgi:hypothetical protein